MLKEIQDISCLSVNEYVSLIASFHYHSRPKQFNCEVNKRKLKDKRLEAFLNRNGCDKRISKDVRQNSHGVNFHDCFCNHLNPRFDYFLSLYSNFNKGFLPFNGSVSDQPNKVMEIFSLLDSLNIEKQTREAKTNK